MKLDVIRNEIQKVAEAISLVLKIDVTIVNEDMKRIAGTGIYKSKIGEIIRGFSAFKSSFEDKKTLIIDEPRESVLCQMCYKKNHCEEKAELCCPILLDDKCYGVIGLIAFDDEQKKLITEGKENLVLFMEKMAGLISGNINAEIKSYDYNIQKEKILKIIDSMDKPIVAIDEKGNIDNFNRRFLQVFRVEKDPTGKMIDKVIDFFDMEDFELFKTSEKKSESYYCQKQNFKGIYNISKIFYKNITKGYVIDFVDKKDAIKNYNRMNIDYRMTLDDIVGHSEIINFVKDSALKASHSTSTVLITGESGTGKEMFARAIHSHSTRREKPFVTINCAAIPGELLESELFGYEEGAFTGAVRGGKLGLFEIANKGTIFLDEIGDMSLHLQSKLLRVLQEKEIRKVGSKKTIDVDVRIISATNKNLMKMVENGLFREDLYYRLNVIPIQLPALRNRKSDIPDLVEHMVKMYSQKLNKNIYGVSKEVMDILQKYQWPGNIRELQNVIEYCINMTNSEYIDDTELIKNRLFIREGIVDIGSAENEKGENKISNDKIADKCGIRKIEDLEKEEIKKAVDMYRIYKKDKDIVAEKLGISKATLYRKMKKYNIE